MGVWLCNDPVKSIGVLLIATLKGFFTLRAIFSVATRQCMV